MSISNCFYKNRVALNVLSYNIENAKGIYHTSNGIALVGILSKDYDSVDSAVEAMQSYGEVIDQNVSIGLGAGDNKQAAVVAEIAKEYGHCHINQVLPFVGQTSANFNQKDGWINALVSPSGRIGYVNISTGPHSSNGEHAIVPVESAINIVKDMGGQALKYFPMKGLVYKEEYKEVARICGKESFALEPTGGIDLDNFEEILTIALKSNVPKIIPHVYSSIIDKQSGETSIEAIHKLYTTTRKLVDQYE